MTEGTACPESMVIVEVENAYILVKAENFDRASKILVSEGYTMVC